MLLLLYFARKGIYLIGLLKQTSAVEGLLDCWLVRLGICGPLGLLRLCFKGPIIFN